MSSYSMSFKFIQLHSIYFDFECRISGLTNTECISIKICIRLIAWNKFRHTVICKTSGTGFWAFYTPKREAIYFKNFINKLNSAENYFTKLGTPMPEHLPTDWINS
jgi:hypothetical protein